MAQVNLSGQTIDEAKELCRVTEQREWVKEQIIELRKIRDNIEYYDDLSREPRDEYGNYPFELEREVLGAWWYCNHIIGWDNIIPYFDPSKEYSPMTYAGTAENECMATSLRDCFLAVRRDGVKWDKAHALKRLNKAIEEYEKDLEKPMEDKMDKIKPKFTIEEVGIYDDDYSDEVPYEDELEPFQDGAPLSEYDEADEDEQEEYRNDRADMDKCVPESKSYIKSVHVQRGGVVDKAQAKLGGW